MTITELKTKYQGILDGAKTANRSLTKTETDDLDGIKAEIEKLEAAAATTAVAQAQEQRSAAAARITGSAEPGISDMKANDYLRDLANISRGRAPVHTHMRNFKEAGQDVGPKEIIADVVRVYESQSPILKHFNNLQPRSTGNTFGFTKIVQGSTTGYVKSEAVAGREDTTSTVTMAYAPFKTYSGEKVLVSFEMIDDAVADITKEVITFGTGKGTMALDADLVALLASPFTTYESTAGTTWALTDLSNAYHEIPNRNRYGVSYVMNGATAALIVAQLTSINKPFTDIIGLNADTIVVDQYVANGVVIVGNLDLALAIGMKQPVRVWTQEVSEGVNMEVQPRFAPALRDATALTARKLQGS